MNKFKERTVVYDDDFYKHYEPAYDYKDHDNIPDTEVDYIIGVADVEDINELDLEDINNFLNGYNKYIDRWGSHNGPED